MSKEPEFLDPDDLSLTILSKFKRQTTQALDYRIEMLEKSNDRFAPERLEELIKIRKYIRDLLYKKGSWNE